MVWAKNYGVRRGCIGVTVKSEREIGSRGAPWFLRNARRVLWRRQAKNPAHWGGMFGGKADAKASKPKTLTSQERATLVQETHWDDRDIKALHAIFVRNSTGSDTIPVERLRDLPGTASVPLFHRVLTLHNADKSGLISFSEFAHAMSALSPNATMDEKLQFAFSLFDMNNSGQVEGPEVFQLLRMAMGSNIGDAQLQAVVDQVMHQHPTGLVFSEFAELLDPSDLSKLTISL